MEKSCGQNKCQYYYNGRGCLNCVHNPDTHVYKLQKRNDDLQAENERLKEGYRRIGNWTKAYPLEVFPKPDMKKAAKVLKAAGMTLDAIAADNMRHVLNGVKDIAMEALKG